MTVGDLLAAASAALAPSAGLPDPRREGRALVAAALSRSEAWLLAHAEETVDPILAARVQAWIARRAAGEPTHRIVGTCPFWGRDFAVPPDVLVPRPETELLVERALGLELPARPRLLDVGTGSGCIAVTLALERRDATVVATDCAIGAVAAARSNARRLGAAVRLVACDLASGVAGRFHLVAANLPYVPSADIASLAVEVREHDPRLALDGGADGLAAVRRLLASLPRLLAPRGWVLLELGPGQAGTVARQASGLGLAEAGRVADVGGVERVLALRLG